MTLDRIAIPLAFTILLLGGCDKPAPEPAPSTTAADPDPATPAAPPEGLMTVPEPTDGPGFLLVMVKDKDFGKVSSGTKLEYSFEFRNNSRNNDLVIEKVTSSCGCAVAKLDKMVYGPGEIGHLEMEYTPTGRGVQTQRITILSNSIEPTATIFIRADVKPFGWPTPRRVDFRAVAMGESHVLDLRVTTPDLETVVQSIDTGSPYVTIEEAPEDEQPTLRRNWGRQYKVTLSPDAPWGALNTTIMFTFLGKGFDTDTAAEIPLNVPVHATVFREVFPDPDTIRMGRIDPDAEFAFETLLTAGPGVEFAITSSRVETETGFTGAVVEVDRYETPGRFTYRVTLKGAMNSDVGEFAGVIVLETDLPDEAELRIPFEGYVKESEIPETGS